MEKEVHNYFHKEDIHCNVSDKHFHSMEHHCSICDFTNDVSGAPAVFHQALLLTEICSIDFFFPDNNVVKQKEVFRPLRAPPFVV